MKKRVLEACTVCGRAPFSAPIPSRDRLVKALAPGFPSFASTKHETYGTLSAAIGDLGASTLPNDRLAAGMDLDVLRVRRFRSRSLIAAAVRVASGSANLRPAEGAGRQEH